MTSVGSKRSELARSIRGSADGEGSEMAVGLADANGHDAPPLSLRDRLAAHFRAGHNASDRELAALFGASVGSISVYRCQLKKIGIGLASPPRQRAPRAAKRERRPAGAKSTRGSNRAAAGELSGRGKGGNSRGGGAALIGASGAHLEPGLLNL